MKLLGKYKIASKLIRSVEQLRSFHLSECSKDLCKDIPILNAWPKPIEPGFTCGAEIKDGKALIIGIYTNMDDPDVPQIALTRTAMKYNEFTCGKLMENLRASGNFPKLGETRLFYNIEPSFPVVCLVGLGHECYGYNKVEQRDEAKEAIRVAAGAGCKEIQNLNLGKLYIESLGHTESTAEGAALSLWVYQDLKNKVKRKRVPYLALYDDCDWTGWQIGLEKASAQNLTRQLMETPSNLMTPTGFALSAVESLVKVGVNVEVRVQEWAKENNMEAFLAAAKGSYEPPVFLEISYNGCEPCIPPVVLVGKGITFDSGGLCLKSHQDMEHMRGDMAGAANVVATVRALASLKLPINVRGIMPLCENMIGASATRPGDIVRAMNGKSILIANVDYEGQLVLADALAYSQKYKPNFIVDIGTLTKGAQECLSNAASVVFTNNDNLWTSIKAASIHTGDRVWRFPLWEVYNDQIQPSHVVCDLTNLAEGNNGYTCTTAAFLRHFICRHNWIHMDTYGIMLEDGTIPYLHKGMSGRPTRTLIEFLAQFGCRSAHEDHEQRQSG